MVTPTKTVNNDTTTQSLPPPPPATMNRSRSTVVNDDPNSINAYEELIHQLEMENAELRAWERYWHNQAFKFMGRLHEVIYWYEGDPENEESDPEDEEEEENDDEDEDEDEEEWEEESSWREWWDETDKEWKKWWDMGFIELGW